MKYTKGRHAILTQFLNELQIRVCTDTNDESSILLYYMYKSTKLN